MPRASAISVSEEHLASSAARKRTAEAIAGVFSEQHYFCIIPCGAAADAARRAEALAREYLLRPLHEKLQQLARTGCGYLPSPGMVGMPLTEVSPNEVYLAHCDPERNPWPELPQDFRAAVSAYNLAAEQLCLTLLELLAIGLGLPEKHYSAQAGKSSSFLKLFRFPAPQPEAGLRSYRLAPHHDYSAVSLIRCAERPNGLQVLSPKQEWVEAYPDQGGLIVLLGEQMTRWSDGRLSATWHRVQNPALDDSSEGTRTSTCYFFNPECMAGDVDGYLTGRADFAKACELHLAGTVTNRAHWESPASHLET
jgi:isopenicillin N synthase-like dioxygenase